MACRRGQSAATTVGGALCHAVVLILGCIAASPTALGQDALSSDGSRKALADKGITYELNYLGEWQANVAGGLSQGSIYIGRLEGVVDVEVNYQMQVLPGLQMDLDLQRIVHPGGNIAGPSGAAISDATVLTLHTFIKY
jgi:carbohydrate-selective porin OprB